MFVAGLGISGMMGCQKKDNEVTKAPVVNERAHENENDSIREITGLKPEEERASSSASVDIVDKVSEEMGDTHSTSTHLSEMASEKIGDAYNAAGAIADKATEKIEQAYNAAAEMANETAEKIGMKDASGNIAETMAGKADDIGAEEFDIVRKTIENSGAYGDKINAAALPAVEGIDAPAKADLTLPVSVMENKEALPVVSEQVLDGAVDEAGQLVPNIEKEEITDSLRRGSGYMPLNN